MRDRQTTDGRTDDYNDNNSTVTEVWLAKNTTLLSTVQRQLILRAFCIITVKTGMMSVGHIQGVAKKSSPLKLFTVFSATV